MTVPQDGAPAETRWVVLTGAPSSGKTTLIDMLAAAGYSTIGEAARDVFDECLSAGLSAADIRGDEAAFQAAILGRKVGTEQALAADDLIFLDRGLPDSISYYRLNGLDPDEPRHLCRARKYQAVFLLDRLPLQADGMRTENDATADRIDHMLEQDYQGLGYPVIRVPVLPPAARLQFVLDRCPGCQATGDV